MTVVFEPYTPDLKPGVLALLMRHWGHSDFERAREFFEWRYENNPRSASPAIVVAREGRNVVGLRCFVILTLRRGSRTLLAACPADAIVHPSHRRRGILRELTVRSLDHLREAGATLVLNLSANRFSAPAARKLGWKEVGMTRYMYRVTYSGFGLPNLAARRESGRQGTANVQVGPLDDMRLPMCRHPRVVNHAGFIGGSIL